MPIIPDYEPYRGGEHRPSVASPGGAGVVAEANAQLGQIAGKVAQDLGEIHQRVARVKKEGARNEADLIIGREVDDFDDFRRTNPDESGWLPELQARRERATREVAKLGTDDVFKEELLARVNLRFQTEEKKNTGVAMAQASRRARQSASGNVERLVAAGDYDAALEVVQRGRAEELFSAEEAEADAEALRVAKEEHGKKMRTAARMAEMDDDPVGVVARLESGEDDPELEPSARASLLRHGQDLLARRREDEYRTLSHGIAKLGVTETELAKVPQYLGEETKELLLTHARRTSPPDAAEQRAGWSLLDEVSGAFGRWSEGALDDAGYMDAFAAAREKIQATVPPGWSGRLMGALEAFSPERVIGPGGTSAQVVQAREKKRIEIRVRNLALRAQDEGLMAEDDPAMSDLLVWLDGEPAPGMGQAVERFQQGLSGRLAGTVARDLAGVLPGSSRALFPPAFPAAAGNTNLTDIDADGADLA